MVQILTIPTPHCEVKMDRRHKETTRRDQRSQDEPAEQHTQGSQHASDARAIDNFLLSQLLSTSPSPVTTSALGQQHFNVAASNPPHPGIFMSNVPIPHSGHSNLFRDIQSQPFQHAYAVGQPPQQYQHPQYPHGQFSQPSSSSSMIHHPQNQATEHTEAEMDTFSSAEDKRRRNTAASARFRIKKKHRTLALERSVADLEGRAEDLEREAADLRRENGWLKEMLIMKGRRSRKREEHSSGYNVDRGSMGGDSDEDSADEQDEPRDDDGQTQSPKQSSSRKGKEKA